MANELDRAAEMLFSPGQITGSHHSYFGPSSPAPTFGIHLMAHAVRATSINQQLAIASYSHESDWSETQSQSLG